MRTSIAAVLCPFIVTTACAADSAEVEALKKQVQGLQRTVEQLQRTIQSMQKETAARDEKIQHQVQQVEAAQKQQTAALQARLESPLDQALKELGGEERQPVGTDLLSRRLGGANLRLLDLSLDGLFAGGASTE
jgi:predicted nuclease with TOPRIM domain